MLIDDALLTAIDEQIEEIGLEYKKVQGLILTEDDLKCVLYSRLIQLSNFAQPAATRDPWITASYVHSEISWFDSAGALSTRVDLAVVDPSDLSIIHSVQDGFRLPSKGFHSIGDAIIFELKFIREANGMTEAKLRRVRRDVEKIKRLYQEREKIASTSTLICYIVFLSKFANEETELIKNFQSEMAGDKHFRVFFSCGDVSSSNPALPDDL